MFPVLYVSLNDGTYAYVMKRWDLRLRYETAVFYILHVDCVRLQAMDGAS